MRRNLFLFLPGILSLLPAVLQAQAGASTPAVSRVTGDSVELAHIVITPFGIPRDKTGISCAIQEISPEELNDAPGLSITDNLSGKAAGLLVTTENTLGGSVNVILRGLKSFTQTNQALFVVDGIPFDNTNHSIGGYDLGNGVADINPEDIASISVLKGGAASALYGSRGANGVIMITTGKGGAPDGAGMGRGEARGPAGTGLGITAAFDVTVGSPDKGTLPVYQTQYGQGYGNNFYEQGIPGVNGGDPVLIAETPYDAATGPAYQNGLMIYNWDAFSPSDPNFHKATPWVAAAHHNPIDFFVAPVTFRESIFVNGGAGRTGIEAGGYGRGPIAGGHGSGDTGGHGRGGTEGYGRRPEEGTFKMGFTHTDDKGFLPNSRQDKNMLTLAVSHPLSDRITAGGEFNYVQTAGIGRNLYLYTGTSNIMTDFREWWPTNVNIRSLKNDYMNSLTNATWNWLTAAYSGNMPGPTPHLDMIALPAYHDNPYWEQYQNYEQDARNRFYGNAYWRCRVWSWLTVRGDFTGDVYTQTTEQRGNVGSQGLSFFDRYNQTYSEINYDGYLEAARVLGRWFRVRALLGGNIRREDNQSFEARTNGGLVVPGLYTLSNSADAPAPAAETDFRKDANAFFAEAACTYKGVFDGEATLRRDESSSLPLINNTYYYPSVSGSIIFSRLVRKAKWFGKAWANYAAAGSDLSAYALYNTYSAGVSFNGSPVYSAATVNGNPDLKPEFNKTVETGIDVRLWQDRIGFTGVYYRSVQTGQIMPAAVSSASGFDAFYVNAGAVQNRGTEWSVYLNPVKDKRFSWTVSLNVSANESKVLSLYNGQPSYEVSNYQNSIQLVAERGKAYGVLRGTDYVYSPRGQREIDASGHYLIAPDVETDIGNINPKWIGGLTNRFSYKGFSFGFLIDVRKGGDLYSLDMDYGSSSGLYPRTAGRNDLGNPVRAPLTEGGGIILKGVGTDGRTPNTHRIDESDISTGNYSFGSQWGEADKSFVYDASYVKLREVSLVYTVPSRVFSHAKVVREMSLSLSGRNLWIIHKNEPYADPEQGQASGNGSMGFQSGAYPMVRTISAEVKWTM